MSPAPSPPGLPSGVFSTFPLHEFPLSSKAQAWGWVVPPPTPSSSPFFLHQYTCPPFPSSWSEAHRTASCAKEISLADSASRGATAPSVLPSASALEPLSSLGVLRVLLGAALVGSFFFAWKKPGVLDAMEDPPPCGWPTSGQLRGPLLLFLFSWSVSQRSSTSWLLPEIVHLSSFPPFLKPLDLKESQCCRVGYRPLCVLRFGSVKAGMRLGANCNSGSCSCTSAFQKRVFTFCGWTGRFWHL